MKAKFLLPKEIRIIMLFVAIGIICACKPAGVDPEEPVVPEEPAQSIPDVFKVFEIKIVVENNAPIVSKDVYLNCTLTIDGKGIFNNYSGTSKIRGRGNSSWEWYEKKPYRLKLSDTCALLGLKSDKDWILLANYRDPTDLMNTYSFAVADWLGLPFSNHTRYVEVTLNGNYIGLYQMTEQVEQGVNRVNIDETDGWLISLDLDDGPELSPGAGDNYTSAVFNMPICVKNPKPTAVILSDVKTDFAKLETAINSYNYNSVSALLDIPSFINYLILQELVYNVEIDAPRSVFMYKNKGGKYFMGPAWDFDAGFDFDWGTMTTGHNYFKSQELVMGTDPANHTNGYGIPNFFTQMFRNKQFVSEYKKRWNQVKDSVNTHSWNIMTKYSKCMQDALANDLKRWPINKNYNTEKDKMKAWLAKRVEYLTTVINNYP